MVLGEYNELKILRTTSVGLFLGDELGNDVLLPNKFVIPEMKVGDQIKVFVYLDSEDRIVATTQIPFITLNHFGYLKVKDTNKIGAFLDWGLDKDLLVPHKLQQKRMELNRWYAVYLYLDEESDRLVASGKYHKFLKEDTSDIEANQEVDLLIIGTNDLGLDVIINNQHKGLVYNNDIYQDLMPGDLTKGFVKQIRPDGKIDVTLRKHGLEMLDDGTEIILRELKKNEGFLPLTDKSDPEDIKFQLEMSKKSFKKSLGILYKKRMVALESNGIRLL